MIILIHYIYRIQGSKYEYIYEEKNWVTLKECFLKDSLKIRGIEYVLSEDQLQHSALRTTFNAGTLALPKLLKYQQIAGSMIFVYIIKRKTVVEYNKRASD